MEVKDQVAHVIPCEHGDDGVVQDMVVEVSAHHYLVPHVDPGGKVSFKVFKEGEPWVTVIILVVQVLLVLFIESVQDFACR